MAVVTVFTIPIWRCWVLSEEPLPGGIDSDFSQCGSVIWDAWDRGNIDDGFREHLRSVHGIPMPLLDDSDLRAYGELSRRLAATIR
jgi:hypothetical protein